MTLTNTPSCYASLEGDLIIPDSVIYNGHFYYVTALDDYVFANTRLTSVIIPNSVTSIGVQAFYRCQYLTSVTMGNSVTIIGSEIFYECVYLSNIELGNSLIKISSRAFMGCSSLTSIIIPNSVIEIGSSAFYNCKNLSSIEIGNSVSSISFTAFENCINLTSVNITDLDSWCRIEFYCDSSNPLYYASNLYFYGNKITNLIIPNSVDTINNYAFANCKCLYSISVSNSVTTIGVGAFENCNSLKNAIIGKNVTSIGGYAFSGCSLLENLVVLRERPIFINSNVFDGVPIASCDLHVRDGSKIRYDNQDVWKDFLIILEDAEDFANVSGGNTGSSVYGDVNGDGIVTAADVTAIYDILLGNE